MSLRYVVDSSVACKWFLHEIDSDRAHRLKDDHRLGLLELVAPDLLICEVANVLWKRVMFKQQLTAAEAEFACRRLRLFVSSFGSSESIAPRAIQIATTSRHPVYDCLYIAAAEHLACDLITADERMAAKFSADFPFIRRLSTI